MQTHWIRIVLVFVVLAGLRGFRTPGRLIGSEDSLSGRYLDGSLSGTVREMDSSTARAMLSEVLGLIREQCCVAVDGRELLVRALVEMKEMTGDKGIIEQYGADEKGLAALGEVLARLIEQYSSHEGLEGDFLHFSEIESVCESIRGFSERAGLGSSWPEVEMGCSLASNLDGYSRVFSPSQTKRFYGQINGHYRGFGVDLTFSGKYPLIFDVVSNSPAERSGIEPGDYLTAIGGSSTLSMPRDAIRRELLRHSTGRIGLTCLRGGREMLFQVAPAELSAPSVRYIRMLNESEGIGYFRLAGFDDDTAMEIRRAIGSLEQRGVRSLVIDLRDNGGGIFSSGIDSLGVFMEGAAVCSMSKGGLKRYFSDSYGYDVTLKPLVLLVNEHTASAAELFAGALQEYGRAHVVGQPTRGKQCVQTIYRLGSVSLSVSITTSTWSIKEPDPDSLNKVTPDILVDRGNGEFDEASILNYLSVDSEALRTAMETLRMSRL